MSNAVKFLFSFKHCLVKWSGLEYERATWELTSQVVNCGHANDAIARFFRLKCEERNAQFDSKYRTDLVRTKALQLRQTQLDKLLLEGLPQKPVSEVNLADLKFGL